MPPDEKAFREANRIIDPATRIEALQKFKKDFPKSASAETVDLRILTMLATTMPDQTSRTREQAKLMYRTAGRDAKGRTSGAIANVLLNASVLLKEAERYAQRSVHSFNQERYIKEQLAGARARKSEPHDVCAGPLTGFRNDSRRATRRIRGDLFFRSAVFS